MRFFLNLDECGLRSPDHEGFERDTVEEARAAGIQAARDIMAAEVKEGKLCLNCRIEITDSDGAVVVVVPFRDALVVQGAA